MPGISIRSLLKKFGELTALDQISFEVAEGEVVSILGPSGCGKTTTLRCVAGLERGDAGQIYIQDRLVSDFSQNYYLPPDQRDIGMVFQSYAIWPHMTVFKNVAYPLVARKFPKNKITKMVERTLALVGMQDFADRQATKLSGGQQQRVALARALVAEPKVLLLDEPLSNLDAKLRDQTRFEVRQIQRRLGVTALYVTHDQGEAMAISDRIVVMNKGNIEQIGPPRQIYQKPSSTFVADFVGSSNFFDVSVVAAGPEGFQKAVLDNDQEILIPRTDISDAMITISLRPQYCTVLPETGEPAAGQNCLKGKITRLTYFGERSEALVGIGQSQLVVYIPLDMNFKADDPVQIAFSPQNCIPLEV
jgi:iron(III) transport system ATP-binding protein